MKLFISDFIEFVVNKWTELDGYRKASSRNKVKMKIGKLKIKNIKEIQTHQNCLPCRRKVQEVDRVYSEGPRMMMETLVYVSDPWSHLSHPFEYRLHRMPLCRYYLNPRRYFVLAVIANLSAAVKWRKFIFSLFNKLLPNVLMWMAANDDDIMNEIFIYRKFFFIFFFTCVGIVSVGPPSDSAWLNNDSLISMLLSRSRDSFDLSRSRRNECCCIDTWSLTCNWSSVRPCCFL